MGKLMPLQPDESKELSESFHFPSNWVVEFAQYAFNEVRDGTHDSPKDSVVGVPLVTSKNLINGVIDFTNTKTISFEDHSEISKRSGVSTGDLLFSMIGTIGNVAVVPENTNFSVKNVGLFRRNDDLLNRRFAYYWLKSQPYQKYLEDRQRGGNQKFVSLGILRESPIPIPPLAEQKVIADKLDTLLAQVDNTKGRLERIPEILKSFRQSVLAAAVSGKLTEEWRDACSYELKKYCTETELFAFRGLQLPSLPSTWQWLRFDQVADIASNLVDPFENLTEIHVAPNHIESWTGVVSGYQTIEEDGVTSAKHRFRKGQILYSKIRPYLAKVAIAEFDGLCSADMYPINCLIDTQYLYRWMLTSVFTDWASNAESRSVLPKINQKDLSIIPVPTPTKEEQVEIVRRVEELFAFADRIEQAAQAAQSRVNNLTQSILAKAFRGELTADWRAANLELISGDNSAEALLAKIKAERTKLSKKTKAKA